MSEYQGHPPGGGGGHPGSDLGPVHRYPHPLPDHYSSSTRPTSTQSYYTAPRDNSSARLRASHDGVQREHYRDMEYPPSSRKDIMPSSRVSVASYPPSEAGSTIPPPMTISSPQPEVDLSTSKMPLHPVTPQPVVTPANEFHPSDGRRVYEAPQAQESLESRNMLSRSHSGYPGENSSNGPRPPPTAQPRHVSDPSIQTAQPDPALASAQGVSAHSTDPAPAVPTWTGRHEPGNAWRGRTNVFYTSSSYDANSVAVKQPRRWGGHGGSGQQPHQSSEQEERRSSLSLQPAPDEAPAHHRPDVGGAMAPVSAHNVAETAALPLTPGGHSMNHGQRHSYQAPEASAAYQHGQSSAGSVGFTQQGNAPSPVHSRHVSPMYQARELPPASHEAYQEHPAAPQDTFHQPPVHREDYGTVNSATVTAAATAQHQPPPLQPPASEHAGWNQDPARLNAVHSVQDVHLQQRHTQEPWPEQTEVRDLQQQPERPKPRAVDTRPPPAGPAHPSGPYQPGQPANYAAQPPNRGISPPRGEAPPRAKVSHGRPTPSIPAHDASNDQGWGPKSPELTANSWTKPSIHAWANDVNNKQPDPAVPALHDDVDDVSLPGRPDSARPVPKPVTVFISPDASPGHSPPVAGMASLATEVVERIKENEAGKASAADKSAPSASAEDDDDFDRPPTPSESTEGAEQSMDARTERNTDFWWEKPHPRDCPTFQSRRVIVSAPFPIRTEAFHEFLSQHFARYGPIRCVCPFPLHTSGQSDRAIVVFKYEDSVVQLRKDDKRHLASFQSTSTSQPVGIRLDMWQRPADAEFVGFWIKVTGPRHDDRSRSASPTIPDKNRALENVDRRLVPPSLEVWALPEPGMRGRTVWKIHLWDPRDDRIEHDSGGATGENTRLQTFDLGRRTLDKDFLPKLVSFYCEIQEIIAPKDPSEPWRFVTCRSQKLNHFFDQLRDLPGFSFGRWNLNARWRGNSPEPSFTPEDIDRGGDHDDNDVEGGPAKVPRGHQPLLSTPRTFRRKVIPTYKGRPLREEPGRVRPQFIDDSAIFISGLSREETAQSLTERYSRFGEVAGVEMEPARGIARVMFHDKKAAYNALQYGDENDPLNAVNRIKDRRVPIQFVEKTEVFVDEQGRIVDLSEVREQELTVQAHAPALQPEAEVGAQAKESQGHIVSLTIPVSSAAGSSLEQFYMVKVEFPESGPPQQTAVVPFPAAIANVYSTTSTVGHPSSRTISRCGTEDTKVTPSRSNRKTPTGVFSPPLKNSSPKSPPIDPNEHKPRLISAGFDEAGLYRATYDAEELKAWKTKNGIPEEEESRSEPKAEPPLAEAMPLLHVSTGGHAPEHGSDSGRVSQMSASNPSNVGGQHAPLPLDQRNELSQPVASSELPRHPNELRREDYGRTPPVTNAPQEPQHFPQRLDAGDGRAPSDRYVRSQHAPHPLDRGGQQQSAGWRSGPPEGLDDDRRGYAPSGWEQQRRQPDHPRQQSDVHIPQQSATRWVPPQTERAPTSAPPGYSQAGVPPPIEASHVHGLPRQPELQAHQQDPRLAQPVRQPHGPNQAASPHFQAPLAFQRDPRQHEPAHQMAPRQYEPPRQIASRQYEPPRQTESIRHYEQPRQAEPPARAFQLDHRQANLPPRPPQPNPRQYAPPTGQVDLARPVAPPHQYQAPRQRDVARPYEVSPQHTDHRDLPQMTPESRPAPALPRQPLPEESAPHQDPQADGWVTQQPTAPPQPAPGHRRREEFVQAPPPAPVPAPAPAREQQPQAVPRQLEQSQAIPRQHEQPQAVYSPREPEQAQALPRQPQQPQAGPRQPEQPHSRQSEASYQPQQSHHEAEEWHGESVWDPPAEPSVQDNASTAHDDGSTGGW